MISHLQGKADNKLETLLDNNNYDESQLIEIRVALNMPYQERFTEYERQYGELEIDGKSCTYVKRKIEGDIVIFKCIANTEKQQLKSIGNDWTGANSGSAMDHSGNAQQKNSFAKNFWSDYDDQVLLQSQHAPVSLNGISFADHFSVLPAVSLPAAEQPPEC